MPGQDPLAKLLGEEPAAALREELARRNQTIEADHTGWKAEGYSGAVLAAVVVENELADNPSPIRCIAKLCPPAAGRPESSQLAAALRHTYERAFVDKHLVGIAFEPVQCPGGEIIMGQRIAGGSFAKLTTLSKVPEAQLGKVCRTVRIGLLEHWTGPKFRRQPSTVPQLLERELRDGLTGCLVPPEVDWIITDEDGAMPNPIALIRDAGLAAAKPKPRLIGHSHGDLHCENIIVRLTTSGVARADEFQLVDLSAFDPSAPLSRDPATLLVSIVAHRVHELDHTESDALLGYLVDREQRPAQAPTDLSAVIDALCDPGEAPFAAGWREMWDEQLQVSLLASALLHTTYDSVQSTGRWWCLRLAGRLARALTPERRPDSEPLRLTADIFSSSEENRRTSRIIPPKPTIINQDKEKAALRAALLGTGPGIIVVHGATGVGKSALVRNVTAELRAAGVHVIERDAAGLRRPDAMTLVEDFEDGAADDCLRPGESLVGRLTAAIDALDTRVAVLIDQADVLLHDETHSVLDEDFDDALELLTSSSNEMAKIVLVARKPPRSAQAHSWPLKATKVHIQGLQQPHFGRFLAWLDPSGHAGLTALNASQVQTLRDRLQGNPSHARLAQIIVQSVESPYGAGTLVEEVANRGPGEVPQFLADALMEQLSDRPKLLLTALAAFGTPVEADAIAVVVEEWLSARNVVEMLHKLANQRVIEVNDGRYSLPPADPYRIHARPPVTPPVWRKMLHNAARQLGFRLKDPADVQAVDDLYTHFALIDVLLRSERYEAAHEMLDTTDRMLRRWDRELLLLGRREYIRERLETPQRKMSNLNSLGDLYTTRGRFADAAAAYQASLDIAAQLHDPPNHLRIRINMAAMHWEAGETEAAADLYSLALSENDLHNHLDAADAMEAGEGLADCYRRWGEYHRAMTLARWALGIARRAGSDRAVTIALKLARWHAETGNLCAANEHLALAETLADEQSDRALRTACADAQADLLLDRDRPGEALRLAEGVLSAARRQRSPVILLQAHTIRCMAYLRLSDVSRAHEAIESADRYRRAGRSLIVPALYALVAALDGDAVEAGRRFAGLRYEVEQHRRDPKDVGALHYLGYAYCWSALSDNLALSEAVRHFRAARDRTRPAASGVWKLLAYLVRRLEEPGSQHGRLRPVLDVLT